MTKNKKKNSMGSLNNASKLTEEQVRDIRRMHEQNYSPKEIHEVFHFVSIWCIYKVLERVSWPMI